MTQKTINLKLFCSKAKEISIQSDKKGLAEVRIQGPTTWSDI